MNVVSWTTIIGAYMFRRSWRVSPSSSAVWPWWRRLLVLSLCGLLYGGLWSSYLYHNAEVVHNGDKIKLRDAVGNFMKSPAVQEFWRNLVLLWSHLQHNGFWSTWSQLLESLDPFGEKNALRVLGLSKGATQDEIRAKYRELSKVHHPDKVKGNDKDKEEAQQKFVGIQQAYEKLSTLKKSRAKANKKSERDPNESSGDVKIEL